MSEERISALEQQVTELRVSEASKDASIEHLAAAVTALSTTVQELRDTMNRGKGAMWAFGVVSAAAGGTTALIVDYLTGKH